MQRLWRWLDKHLLEIGVIALFIFIPLYPKFPLIDVPHTWVYIRLEDFLIAAVVGLWFIQLLRRKVSLKSPLTRSILFYWTIGAISTVLAIYLYRGKLLAFFPHLVILHYLRRIEYMVLFFVTAASISNWGTIKRYLVTLGLVTLVIVIYGFGQKFLGWPAFSTMNEEYAKGIALYLTPHARVFSTFGGHYDLAAFLVLIISVFISFFFFIPSLWLKGLVGILCLGSFGLLLLTISRVSFVCYLVGTTIVLAFLKNLSWIKKGVLWLAIVAVSIIAMLNISEFNDRFFKTFRVNPAHFKFLEKIPKFILTTPSEQEEELVAVSDVDLLTQKELQEKGILTTEGEPLSEEPAHKKYWLPKVSPQSTLGSAEATIAAQREATSAAFTTRPITYDRSVSIRIYGEWPKAISGFKKNPFLGTGYSSLGLSIDNSFLRALGETGLFGLLAFLLIFWQLAKLLWNWWRRSVAGLARALVLGVAAGTAGLMLNASFIDVFEASKVATIFWMLIAILVATVQLSLARPLKKRYG
jgi:hypothetical protein